MKDRKKLSRATGASEPSAADRAYEQIQRRIVAGDLAPGARLVEREVAEKLGVSRTPVREAVRRLVQEGFVRWNPGAAYARPVVAELTSADAAELHEIVAGLESAAARRVAALPLEERKTIVERLRQRNREMADAGHRKADIGELIQRDHAFHAEYLEPVSGARLMQLRLSVKPQLERYARHYSRALARELPLALAEHEAIMDAFLAGDADRAESAVGENWRAAAKRLGNLIRRSGEVGSW